MNRKINIVLLATFMAAITATGTLVQNLVRSNNVVTAGTVTDLSTGSVTNAGDFKASNGASLTNLAANALLKGVVNNAEGGSATNLVDVITTNGNSLAGAVMAADLGTAAYLDEGDVVLSTTNSITVSGLETATRTYTPTAEVYYVTCPVLHNISAAVAAQTDVGSTYYAHTLGANNDRVVYSVPPNATSVEISGYFKETGADATNGARIATAIYSIRPSDYAQIGGLTYTNMLATNTLFTITSIPVGGSTAFPGQQLHIICADTNETILAIQDFGILSVRAAIPLGDTANVLGTFLKDAQDAW